MDPIATASHAAPLDFIREIIVADRQAGRHGGRVHTRFPPEPNGYLHIGHAKAICLNFGVADEFGGRCNLRMDDTNPTKEDIEYVESIEKDVAWLGFRWHGEVLYAADYFEQMYQYAERLIAMDKAYVDDLTADQIRAHRGSLTEPGHGQPLSQPAEPTRAWICSAACAPASSPTARACCARRSTWRRPT